MAVVNCSKWDNCYAKAMERSWKHANVLVSASGPRAGSYLKGFADARALVDPLTSEELLLRLQRHLRAPLTPPPPPPHDAYGDSLCEGGKVGAGADAVKMPNADHTHRHNAALYAAVDMANEAFGESNVDFDVRDGRADVYNDTHVADVAVHAAGEVHCGDVKTPNPFTAGIATIKQDERRGAHVLMANTWEEQLGVVQGRPELSRPPGATGSWSRVNGTGHVSAIVAQYIDAQEKDNPVYCMMIEALCGTFSPGLLDFVAVCAEMVDDRLRSGFSWTAASFTAHHCMRISTAFNKALAKEMLRRLSIAFTKCNTRKRAKPGANRARLDAAKAKHGRRDFTFGDFVRPGAAGSRFPRSRA